MSSAPTSNLLGRRLDRLRSLGPAERSPSRIERPDHAASLAAALGGTVVSGVVIVESSVTLPVDRRALGSLPFPAGVDQPLVCLDLETTGLATASGTLAFLVGLGTWEGDTYTVRQLLLPDHAAELRLLDVLSRILPPDAWLVTYNGRTFDWPLLVARHRMHRRVPPPLAGHLDLLTVARRLWKPRIGGARLSLVEREICAVTRDDDLPGALVPERYFGYLRSRGADLLRPVLDHNRQDIVSLGLLLGLLASDYAAPATWTTLHPGDAAGLAVSLRRSGRINDALRCTEAAIAADAWTVGFDGAARLRRHLLGERARLLARLGRRVEAHQAWLEICARGGPGAAAAWLHVARYREHVARDLGGALEACREAAAVADRARAWGKPMPEIERDLNHRLARLRRRSLATRRFSGAVARAA